MISLCFGEIGRDVTSESGGLSYVSSSPATVHDCGAVGKSHGKISIFEVKTREKARTQQLTTTNYSCKGSRQFYIFERSACADLVSMCG
ncbi:hypothetical protein EVAR_57770_1 [Eumeta japonica]|uniref:Uncharacterized protein n=1 Tax=Eumeta variegata TaxID=151549 RepID=A0A4C1Y840_EUMVA|nr:hypothetical protein EVAR_57770_1 [Eumeta japonica]